MNDLESITRQLAEVQDELLALADDDFAARYELQKRQDTLREQAATFAQDFDEQRSDEDLLAELGALRARLAGVEGQKIDMVQQTGSAFGSGSGAWGYDDNINRALEQGHGVGDLRARIGRIKGILMDRGVELPSAE